VGFCVKQCLLWITHYIQSLNGKRTKLDLSRYVVLYFTMLTVSGLVKKLQYSETVHQLFTDYNRVSDLVRRKVLYSILIEFGVPMKLVRLIKMCLNETCNKVHIGKYLLIIFLSKMVYPHCTLTSSSLLWNIPGGTETEKDTSALGLCWWCESTGR
jgi:hypothetical protein